MTRVLVIQTASAKRLQRAVETILAGGVYPKPEITVLCNPEPLLLEYFWRVRPQVRVIPLPSKNRTQIWADLRRSHFDIVRVFWTGEKKYRSMKLAAFGLWPCPTDVESGDGGVFRLTWKAVPRHLFFRWQHPLPTDHWELVPVVETLVERGSFPGERVLIIQSAEPPVILRAFERLKANQPFRNPRYSIFCRKVDEHRFRDHPMLYEVLNHSETAGSWGHLKQLRRKRFDGLVLFLTGDPSYWKVKYFAFLLGARHKLIFNESYDCFFFSLGEWLRFLAHRLGKRSYQPFQSARAFPRWFHKFRFSLWLLIKFGVLPLRFAWLLLTWLRLRLGNNL